MIKVGLSFSSVGAGVGAPVVGDGVGTDVDGLTVGAGVGLGVGFGVGLGVESAVGAVVDGHAPQVIGQICWTRFRVAGLGWAQNATSWLQEAGFPNKVIPVTSASAHTSLSVGEADGAVVVGALEGSRLGAPESAHVGPAEHAPQVAGQVCWIRLLIAGLGWVQNATSWLQEAGFPNKVIPVTSASVHTSPGWSLRVSKTDAVDAVDAAGSTANPTGNSTAHAVGLDVFGERVGLMVRTPAATGCCSKRKRSEAPRADIVPGTLDMVD